MPESLLLTQLGSMDDRVCTSTTLEFGFRDVRKTGGDQTDVPVSSIQVEHRVKIPNGEGWRAWSAHNIDSASRSTAAFLCRKGIVGVHPLGSGLFRECEVVYRQNRDVNIDLTRVEGACEITLTGYGGGEVEAMSERYDPYHDLAKLQEKGPLAYPGSHLVHLFPPDIEAMEAFRNLYS